jgi:hypothetical protein
MGQSWGKGLNPLEFEGIRMKAGVNSFTLTPKQRMVKTGEVTCRGRGPAARSRQVRSKRTTLK